MDDPMPGMTSDRNSNLSRRRFLSKGSAGLAGIAAGGSAVLASAEARERTNSRRFDGQVVLITGATSGIGEATARAFAEEGASVFFCGRRAQLGEEVAASIREAGGEATFMQADVREEAQVEAFVRGCVERYGRIDVAFNNAGIEGPAGTFADIDLDGEQGYYDVMRTNVDGVFYAMRHELPVMREQESGVIINTGSVLASRGSASSGAYSASKHAVIGFSLSSARANARYGIRVLAISPGPVDTALLRRMAGGNLEGMRRNNPLGVAEPRQLAEAVMNLAHPSSSFMTGANIRVDGGSTA
jgi:NAD(P)-dependent dehydrogenase (short-subunit alcohol dehydrogenase family)